MQDLPGNIAVVSLYPVLRFFQALPKFIRHCDGAVLPSGTANRHNKLVFSLLDITRNQKKQKFLELV